MRRIVKYLLYTLLLTPFIAFALFIIILGVFKIDRNYKIATIREFVYESQSPSSISFVKIYQRGGDSIVHLLTPLEFECTNNFGTTSFTEEIKMGHIYRNSEVNKPDVLWTDDMSGIIKFGRYPSVDFSCKSE